MKKRGSLNLSINAIVVLILAVTLLSLGLTFINSTFGGATRELDKSLKGISEDRKDQLKSTCYDDLCLENTEISIRRNNKESVLAVINNKLDCTVNADIEIGGVNQEECQIIGQGVGTPTECSEHVNLVTYKTQKLRPKETVAVPIDITPKNNADSTRYRYEVTVDGACEDDPDSILAGSEYIDVSVE